MNLCEKCGLDVQIGMFPFCKGNQSDHGRLTHSKNALFPFEVNHVDGSPMVIESMNHLRKVEKDFGVVFSAFSHRSSNNVDAVDANLPKYRGDDPDIRHDYRDRYDRKR